MRFIDNTLVRNPIISGATVCHSTEKRKFAVLQPASDNRLFDVLAEKKEYAGKWTGHQ